MRRLVAMVGILVVAAGVAPAHAGVVGPRIAAQGCWRFAGGQYRWQGVVTIIKGDNTVAGWQGLFSKDGTNFTAFTGGGYPNEKPAEIFNLNDPFNPIPNEGDKAPKPFDPQGPTLTFKFVVSDTKPTPKVDEALAVAFCPEPSRAKPWICKLGNSTTKDPVLPLTPKATVCQVRVPTLPSATTFTPVTLIGGSLRTYGTEIRNEALANQDVEYLDPTCHSGVMTGEMSIGGETYTLTSVRVGAMAAVTAVDPLNPAQELFIGVLVIDPKPQGGPAALAAACSSIGPVEWPDGLLINLYGGGIYLESLPD